MKQTTIAAVLIVKNEEKMLFDCLTSIKWADEIIVLDSGSTDKTKQIARHFTKKLYTDNNWQGYGRQRQKAQTFVDSDWIFMIDADERVTPQLQTAIQKALKDKPTNTIFTIDRISWCFGSFIRHSGWYPDRVIRLYPKTIAGYNDALVHEKVIYKQNITVKALQGDLLHYPYHNMRHYLEKSAEYAQAWSESRFKKGQKTSLLNGLLHALGCFVQMYLVRQGFLDGRQGFLLALLSSHSTFAKYADLWVRNQRNNYQDEDLA